MHRMYMAKFKNEAINVVSIILLLPSVHAPYTLLANLHWCVQYTDILLAGLNFAVSYCVCAVRTLFPVYKPLLLFHTS